MKFTASSLTNCLARVHNIIRELRRVIAKAKDAMKKVDLLLVFFLLVCVEVVESVVQGLILSVNLMDTNGTNATGRVSFRCK